MTARTDPGFTVTVLAGARTTSALIYLAGDIDLTAVLALDTAVSRVGTAGRMHVVVDVEQVTFACSTLANFLVQVRNALNHEATVTVSRSTPATLRVLQALGMTEIVTVTDRFPPASTLYSCGIDRQVTGEQADIGAGRRDRAAVAYFASWIRELLAGRIRTERPGRTVDRGSPADDVQ